MSRFYTTKFSAVAVSAAQDLFEILAPALGAIIIHNWEVFQTSDVGDAAEEILRITVTRGDGAVTTGSGGSTHTPQPVDNGVGVSGAVVEINNTTRMAAGSGVLDELEEHGWNVRSPLKEIYTPELRPVITPTDRWTLSLPDAPADSLTMSGYITYEEIGG